MLTKEQLKARDGKLTASRVGVLMSGDENKILTLWREMLGLEQPKDLSSIWAVRLGEVTEALNLAWYAKKNDVSVRRKGEVVIHPKYEWAAATLDGWDVKRECPVECKHVSGREPLETIIARYMPQVTWQMMCTESVECALSIIMGANEPVVEMIPLHVNYAEELLRRAEAFMLCVMTMTPPVAAPAIEPPAIPTFEYDMTGDNMWGSYAADWLETYVDAEKNKHAGECLKARVPKDARRAFGAGIVVTRNRAGAARIRKFRS